MSLTLLELNSAQFQYLGTAITARKSPNSATRVPHILHPRASIVSFSVSSHF